jgi:hypothetical protein
MSGVDFVNFGVAIVSVVEDPSQSWFSAQPKLVRKTRNYKPNPKIGFGVI